MKKKKTNLRTTKTLNNQLKHQKQKNIKVFLSRKYFKLKSKGFPSGEEIPRK